jgi:hypothetical protein
VLSQAIVENIGGEFGTAGELPPEQHPVVVERAVKMVSASGSEPRASTLKMQVTFDWAFASSERRLATLHARCSRRLDDLWLTIRGAKPAAASDYDQMQRLHRAVLTFVGIAGRAGSMDGPSSLAPGEKLPPSAVAAAGSAAAASAASKRSAAEAKEVAAVVESVFPRASLKSFVSLGDDARRAQLEELVRLVLGIRLFNWKQGRGTVDIVDIPSLAMEEAAASADEAAGIAETASSTVEGYHAALAGGRRATGAALEASGVGAEDEEAALARVARWQREVANRKQLLSAATGVSDDLALAIDKLAEVQDEVEALLAELKASVEGHSSVAKSHVYPRFHALAEAWLVAVAEGEAVRVRCDALRALRAFTAPAVCSLSAAAARTAKAVVAAAAAAAAADGGAAGGSAGDGTATSTAISGSAGVERLYLEAAPAAMELPLGFMAQCPVLLAGIESGPWERAGGSGGSGGGDGKESEGSLASVWAGEGTLVTGDPSLGVLRWSGRQVVCSSEEAVAVFMADPAGVMAQASAAAARRPELVRLLGLEAAGSEMDLAALVSAAAGPAPGGAAAGAGSGTDGVSADRLARATMLRASVPRPDTAQSGGAGAASASAAAALASSGAGAGAGRKCDAGTGTPTHFVESHIVPTYAFSEWELRRRALQAANLHKCATHSTQTDRSHFRRDTETQVWARRDAEAQTGVDAGTNPIHRKTFVVGLRGGAVPVPPRPDDSQDVAAAKRAQTKTATKTTVKTVTLEYVP